MSVVGIAIPDFWLGLMLIVVFAVQWSLFPPTGYVPFVDDPAGWLTSLVLPVITLAVPATAIIAKQTRDAMSTVAGPDLRPHVARGRCPATVRSSTGTRCKNAAIPILTVVGLVFVGALSGTVAVESIFAIPGLGQHRGPGDLRRTTCP